MLPTQNRAAFGLEERADFGAQASIHCISGGTQVDFKGRPSPGRSATTQKES